ncbi:family 10 glycosylhydrolase [Paenibacillus hunanensis]|uniref:family 10 glycosylhydrolase n=1 Tax=Paenibacillus hunanensis TaxID=539262 RepID=UPI0020275088|nr:family 10 glycosylhydrolase [Paenibacillus hunanensis]MCL9659851.1 family 10 glycosylhydrolase [Paenibacillus hunanensis]
MKKIAYSLSAALLAVSLLPWQSANAATTEAPVAVTPIANEITVQTEANFKNADDVNSFIINAARNHVSVINMSVKQDSDVNGNSGYAFYDSKIVKEATGYDGFDALSTVIEQAHQYGIKVRAWIPQFQDKAAIDRNSTWQMRSIDDSGRISTYTGQNGSQYYVNPFEQDVQNYERSIVKEVVTNYNIDGVVLSGMDFDTNRVDMNTNTITSFRATNNFDPKKLDFTKSDNANKVAQWNSWKADQLAAYIKETSNDIRAIKPALPIGVQTDVTNKEGTSPNVAAFSASVDFIMPVVSSDLTAEAVYGKDGIVATTEAQANGKTVIPVLNPDLSTSHVVDLYNGLRTEQPEITTVNYTTIGQYTNALLGNVGLNAGY